MKNCIVGKKPVLSQRLTPPMVVFSLVLLGILTLLVPASLTDSPGLFAFEHVWLVLGLAAVLWLLFIAEFFVLLAFSDPAERTLRYQLNALLAALLPPLRLGARIIPGRQKVWLPFGGWRKADLELSEKVARSFYTPMALVALLVLPLVGLEYLGAELVRANAWLFWTIDGLYRLIWFAFTLEFAVRISIAPGKLAYCKKHIIDLIIIILPLFAFLRILRVLRLANVARLENLARITRLQRLKSGMAKTLRALLLVRLFKTDSAKALNKQISRLAHELAIREQEAGKLRDELLELRDRLAVLEFLDDENITRAIRNLSQRG